MSKGRDKRKRHEAMAVEALRKAGPSGLTALSLGSLSLGAMVTREGHRIPMLDREKFGLKVGSHLVERRIATVTRDNRFQIKH
jgi:hypothetical protein